MIVRQHDSNLRHVYAISVVFPYRALKQSPYLAIGSSMEIFVPRLGPSVRLSAKNFPPSRATRSRIPDIPKDSRF